MAVGTIQNGNKVIWLVHRDRNIQTITQFMERNYIYGITTEDMFELNRESIFTQMDAGDKIEYQREHGIETALEASDLVLDMILPIPCNLSVLAKHVTSEIAINGTNLQVGTDDFYTFASEAIDDIFQDEGYRIEDYTKRTNELKVFGWFKTQYFVGNKGDGSDQKINSSDVGFVELSRYITNLSTSVTEGGGSFTLRLPIIKSQYLNGFIYQDQDQTAQYRTVNHSAAPGEIDFISSDNFYIKSSTKNVEANYFANLISTNDLIFIAFDKLALEDETNKATEDVDTLQLSTALSGQTYDMICLVDNVSTVVDEASASGYVEVSGKDLMKLLIDDGSFFFNPSTTAQPNLVFANESSNAQGDIRDSDQLSNTYNDPLLRMRRPSNELDIFANRINLDISYVLKGVLSQLANVEIVPDYVFQSWGEARTTYLSLFPEEKNTTDGIN